MLSRVVANSPGREPHSTATSATQRFGRIEPLHLLWVAYFVVALIKVAASPLLDPDAFWHVRLGRQLLDGVSPANAGHGWTIAPVSDGNWVSTQWLAEMLMASLQSAFGWNGLLLFRVVCAASLLGLLAITLLPGRPARTAVPVFLLVASPVLLLAVQERPQSLSFLLLVPLSWWALGLVEEDRIPPAWLVLPLSVVWANTHGQWILLPAVLVLAAVSRWADWGLRDRTALRAIGLGGLSLASGMISPDGIGTVTAVLRFHDASKLIDEWHSVSVLTWDSAPLVVWAGLVITAWARGRPRAPRSELIFVGSMLLFGMTAYRNIAPVLILTAPFVIKRTGSTWHPQRAPTSARERRWLLRIAVFAAAAGLIGSLSLGATRPPFSTNTPITLIEKVSGRPEGARILPEYNESGLVLALGGIDTKTAIDGRADLFGSNYISRYVNMLAAGSGWEPIVRQLKPTSAILARTTNLAKALQRCRWRVEASTPTHLLLVPTPGWTCPAGG